MSQPIKEPEFTNWYQIITIENGKFNFVLNPDPYSNGI